MDLKLENVRLSFPDLFVPKEFAKGDGKPRFNATFLVIPGSANDKKIRAAIAQEATTVFGAKSASMLKSMEGNPNKYAYQDGNLKEYEGYEGMMSLACHSKTKPLIIDGLKQPLTAADGKPYAGCYVNAMVSIYVQKGENAGVRASFGGVQFVADGDAFTGGGPASADDFDTIEGGADAADIL